MSFSAAPLRTPIGALLTTPPPPNKTDEVVSSTVYDLAP